MAAVVEVNVSPSKLTIQQPINSMDFYKHKGLAIWKKVPFSPLGRAFRRQHRLERERERGVKTRGFVQAALQCVAISGPSLVAITAEEQDAWWDLWHFMKRWVALRACLVLTIAIAVESCFWIFLLKSDFSVSIRRDSVSCVGLMRPRAETITSVAWELCATDWAACVACISIRLIQKPISNEYCSNYTTDEKFSRTLHNQP